MKKIMKDRRGMTLVEVVVALAILVIGLTIITTGVRAAGGLLRYSSDIDKSGQKASAVLDSNVISEGMTGWTEGSVTFQVAGTDQVYTVRGGYVTSEEKKESSVGFRMFLTEKPDADEGD